MADSGTIVRSVRVRTLLKDSEQDKWQCSQYLLKIANGHSLLTCLHSVGMGQQGKSFFEKPGLNPNVAFGIPFSRLIWKVSQVLMGEGRRGGRYHIS